MNSRTARFEEIEKMARDLYINVENISIEGAWESAKNFYEERDKQWANIEKRSESRPLGSYVTMPEKR